VGYHIVLCTRALSGPFRAGRCFSLPPWVSPTATHGLPLRGRRLRDLIPGRRPGVSSKNKMRVRSRACCRFGPASLLAVSLAQTPRAGARPASWPRRGGESGSKLPHSRALCLPSSRGKKTKISATGTQGLYTSCDSHTRGSEGKTRRLFFCAFRTYNEIRGDSMRGACCNGGENLFITNRGGPLWN
jgi:hypothetical protein